MKYILLVEDDLSLISGLSFAVKKAGYGLDIAHTKSEADEIWEDGKSNTVSGDIYLNFSRTWGKHTLFSNVGWNISENEYMEIINEAQGYKSDSMDEYIFGMMYKEDGKPSGNSSKNRKSDL